MADDLAQLDNRLDKLEEKLQLTFNAIDEKFNEIQKQSSSAPKQAAAKVQAPAGVNPHKIVEIDERFNRLEEKLKLTFGEIEKRFAQIQQQPHYNVEERIEEIEDLLLLLQLENTKVREKIGEGLDFGLAPAMPDISERITRIESELASQVSAAMPAVIDDTKLASLEDKIKGLQRPQIQTDDSLRETIQALEKKVNTLEALLAQRGRQELEDDLLTDIQSILRGR